MPIEDTPSKSSRTTGQVWLLGAVALAAFIQIVLVVRSPAIGKDGMGFINYARHLARTPIEIIRSEAQHPGYPALILLGRWYAALWAGGDDGGGVMAWVVGARLLPGLCGVLSVVVVWLLARRLFDARIAAVAAFFFAVLPLFRENAADAMSDTPCLLLYLTAAWLAAEGLVRKRVWWFALAGASSAASYWVRPEGLSAAVVVAGLLGWMLFRRDRRRFAALSLIPLVLAAAVVALPYIFITGRITGKKDFSTLLRGRLSSTRVKVVSAAATQEPVAKGRKAPGLRKAAGGVVRLAKEYLHKGLRYIFVLPLVLGLFAPGRRRAQPEPRLLVAALVGFHVLLLLLLFVMAGYISGRHIMALSAFSMPWAGAGTVWIAGAACAWAARAGKCPRWLGANLPDPPAGGQAGRLTIILAGLVVAGLLPRCLRGFHAHRIPMMNVGIWLRQSARPDDLVLSNSEYALFYRGGMRILRANRGPLEYALFHGDAERYWRADANRMLARIRSKGSRQRHKFVVFDRESSGFKEAWVRRLRERYLVQPVPGVSGGEREILILRRR